MSDTVTISAKEYGALCLGADLLQGIAEDFRTGGVSLDVVDYEHVCDVADAIAAARKPPTLEERAFEVCRQITECVEEHWGQHARVNVTPEVVEEAFRVVKEADRRAVK